MYLHKDLVLDILNFHFSDIDWESTSKTIVGSVLKKKNIGGFDIELVFVGDMIKISKTSYSHYERNGRLEGIKINVLSDVCITYDEMFEKIKNFVEN